MLESERALYYWRPTYINLLLPDIGKIDARPIEPSPAHTR